MSFPKNVHEVIEHEVPIFEDAERQQIPRDTDGSPGALRPPVGIADGERNCVVEKNDKHQHRDEPRFSPEVNQKGGAKKHYVLCRHSPDCIIEQTKHRQKVEQESDG
jgi:hypothetical protein